MKGYVGTLRRSPTNTLFAVGAISWIFATAIAVGSAPIAFSLFTVFLFAGPHQWFELRYFLRQMPLRWGKLFAFFAVGIIGLVVLSLGSLAMPWMSKAQGWGDAEWRLVLAGWNTAFALWIVVLVEVRRRFPPRRPWTLHWPLFFTWVALVWQLPEFFALALVYMHPLVALWILDGEILRRRPEWKPTYRGCLAVAGLVLAALWLMLAHAPSMPGDDAGLVARLAHNSGGDLLPGISPQLLVGTHAYLETLHYGVWILAIPMIGTSSTQTPWSRRFRSWPTMALGTLAVSGTLVAALWVSFVVDYRWTWDIYFIVSVVHVLAEIPFLVRRA